MVKSKVLQATIRNCVGMCGLFTAQHSEGSSFERKHYRLLGTRAQGIELEAEQHAAVQRMRQIHSVQQGSALTELRTHGVRQATRESLKTPLCCKLAQCGRAGKGGKLKAKLCRWRSNR